MSYATFGTWAFFAYLTGCFIAFALSLRSNPDNRVLTFTYGAWISAAFAAHHLLVPNAAKDWHYMWYVWNAGVAIFPVLPAYMLHEAHSRKPVIIFSIGAFCLCEMYAVASFIGEPLNGWWYFYSANFFESAQVFSLILWSGPVLPVIVKAWNASTKNRRKTWMRRVSA